MAAAAADLFRCTLNVVVLLEPVGDLLLSLDVTGPARDVDVAGPADLPGEANLVALLWESPEFAERVRDRLRWLLSREEAPEVAPAAPRLLAAAA